MVTAESEFSNIWNIWIISNSNRKLLYSVYCLFIKVKNKTKLAIVVYGTNVFVTEYWSMRKICSYHFTWNIRQLFLIFVFSTSSRGTIIPEIRNHFPPLSLPLLKSCPPIGPTLPIHPQRKKSSAPLEDALLLPASYWLYASQQWNAIGCGAELSIVIGPRSQLRGGGRCTRGVTWPRARWGLL